MRNPPSDLVWGDPPPVTRPGPNSPVREFAEILKAHPGEWALWPTPVSDAWGRAARRRIPGIETAMRRRPDGKYDAYVRWIGVPSEGDG